MFKRSPVDQRGRISPRENRSQPMHATLSLPSVMPPPSTALRRIVIADDHPVYRDGLVRALMHSGRYHVAGEAGDGETALRLIVEQRPDVALLDVRMPALDALNVLRRLDRDGIRVPVV